MSVTLLFSNILVLSFAGGEALDMVMGRNEEEELPYFTPGAFEVVVSEKEERGSLFNRTMLERLMPVDNIHQHTMHHLFEQIRTIPMDEVTCAQVISVAFPSNVWIIS